MCPPPKKKETGVRLYVRCWQGDSGSGLEHVVSSVPKSRKGLKQSFPKELMHLQMKVAYNIASVYTIVNIRNAKRIIRYI